MELFNFNFYGTPQTYTKLHKNSIYTNIRNLTASFDATWDSIQTVAYNQRHSKRTFEIDVDGFLIYPDGHDPQGPFSGFPDGMWDLHQRDPEKFLDDAAFESVHEIKKFADKNKIELLLIVTPQHVYYDYYLGLFVRWHIQQRWLKWAVQNPKFVEQMIKRRDELDIVIGEVKN